MDEKKVAELLAEAQKVIEQKKDIDNLKKVLGKIFTENIDLTGAEYKKLKEKVSIDCDENGKPVKMSSEERRERIKENYFGTSINLQANILGLLADMYAIQLSDHELLCKIADKLQIEPSKEG